MGNKKKRIIITLGGNALGNTPPEQMKAVKITAEAIVGLVEEGCEVIIAHGSSPQADMISSAMATLSRENTKQPNTPLSVYVAMSQAYIGYNLQNASGKELYNHGMYDIPVVTMIAQVRANTDDPAFEAPSKPIGRFMTEEQAKVTEEKYGYIMKEDSGRDYRRMVVSPKPAEVVEIGAIRSLVDSGRLVTACGDDGIPVTRRGNRLKDAGAVIDKGFASRLLVENLDADFLIILTAAEKVAVNFGKPEEKWLDDLNTEEARRLIKEGYFAPGSMLPKVQAAIKLAESKLECTALIVLLEKTENGIQGETGTHIHLA